MSSAGEHHREAERLLEEARREQDITRRSLVLREAQVHATLALSAPAGEDLPGPGRSEAYSIESTRVTDSGTAEDTATQYGEPGPLSPGDLRPTHPGSLLQDRTPQPAAPGRRNTWAEVAAGTPGPPDPPLPEESAWPDAESDAERVAISRMEFERTRREAEARRRLARKALDEEEPDDPGKQELGGPTGPQPGGITPLCGLDLSCSAGQVPSRLVLADTIEGKSLTR